MAWYIWAPAPATEVRLREQREAEQRMHQKQREEEVRSAPLWAMGWGFGNKNGGCFSNHNGYPPVRSLAGTSMKIPYNYCHNGGFTGVNWLKGNWDFIKFWSGDSSFWMSEMGFKHRGDFHIENVMSITRIANLINRWIGTPIFGTKPNAASSRGGKWHWQWLHLHFDG